jgi:23S rRNA-/tRNA-specific pseudouridylate synthase
VPLIKIPKHYLVYQDEDSITVNIPESMLLHWKKDYEKITKAKGILKHKKEAMLTHLDTLRQEWNE